MASLQKNGISMIPLILPSDKLLIKKAKRLKENDIIVFNKQCKLVAHRIIYVYPDKKSFVTKGDNNFKSDGEIPYKKVLGKATGVKRGKKTILFSHTYLSQSSTYLKELKRVNHTLRKNGVEYILLKGLPLHLHFETAPPRRIYLDADFLIYKQDLKKAKRILEKLGYEVLKTPSYPENPTQITFKLDSKPFPTVLDLHTSPGIGFTKTPSLNAFLPKLTKYNKYLLQKALKIKEGPFTLLAEEDLVLYLLLHFFHHNFSGIHRLKLISHIISTKKVNIDKAIKLAKKYDFDNFIYPTLLMIKKYFGMQTLPEGHQTIFEKYISRFISKNVNPFDNDIQKISRLKRFVFVSTLSKLSLKKKLKILCSRDFVSASLLYIKFSLRKN